MKRSVGPREFLQALQISLRGRNHAHVGHDAFGDDRGDLAGMIFDGALQRRQIVPRHDDRVVERGAIQAGTVGNLDRVAAQSQSAAIGRTLELTSKSSCQPW